MRTQWHVYQNINSNAKDKEAITWFVKLSRLLLGQSWCSAFCNLMKFYRLCFCWNLLST
ncbi:hypothetical protein Plhal703r1_c31g0121391 [Plasmopara halstedii]